MRVAEPAPLHTRATDLDSEGILASDSSRGRGAANPRVMTYQIVYCSAATTAFDEQDLLALLAVARTNNTRLGVTGMLLFHEGSFIQVLEGERETVETLYDRVAQDQRHAGTRVLARGEVEERSFEEWSMGFRHVRDASALPEGLNSFLTRTVASEKAESVARKALLAFREGRWRLGAAA